MHAQPGVAARDAVYAVNEATMKPIHTNATNKILNAPDNWEDAHDAECVGLPVYVNSIYIYSWWKLTCKERLLLLLGRPIQLCIVGRTHAPVALQVAAIEQQSWWLEIKRWIKQRKPKI